MEPVEGSAPGSERFIAADELRALLREVGDLATRKARIFQKELSTLDESLGRVSNNQTCPRPTTGAGAGKV